MLGHKRGRFTEARFPEAWVAERGWVERPGAYERGREIDRILSTRQGVARNGAVERAGVEISESVMPGDALGDRALAGRRRPVDRYDHRNCEAINIVDSIKIFAQMSLSCCYQPHLSRGHLFGVCILREQMPVGTKRLGDGRMPHALLDHFR